MGRDFFDRSGAARETFEEADEALGFSLSSTIFEGPEEDLRKTALTQPAILTTSVAILRFLQEDEGIRFSPAFVAGHSLGEYTALVAAGSLSLTEGVRLVHLRGKLMQEAVPLGEGSMAAILGLDREVLDGICREAARGRIVEAANDNAPGQIVVSGHADAVERAVILAKERGASRAIPLKVSAPFHCALMRSVADRLFEAFSEFSFSDPAWPVLANATARPVSKAEEIRAVLRLQTYSPVLWADSVRAMAEGGVEAFVEIGPGNVLSGLARRCVKGIKALSVSNLEEVPRIVEFFRGGETP
jgi:[acyl-carrier-protein] S-malonyltransferase